MTREQQIDRHADVTGRAVTVAKHCLAHLSGVKPASTFQYYKGFLAIFTTSCQLEHVCLQQQQYVS